MSRTFIFIYTFFFFIATQVNAQTLHRLIGKWDKNNNSKIEIKEMPPGHKLIARFDDIDCDKSGSITSKEFGKFFRGGKIGCVKLIKREDISGDKKSYLAHLILPEGTGPHPVIVISHGRGGMTQDYYEWGNKFVKLGFASIVIDHYGPRGYEIGSRTKRPETKASFKFRRGDLVSLLKVIKKDDRLDNARVTLGGWSRGAGLVMHGISDKNVLKESKFDHPIKSAILFYPQSTTIFRNFKNKIDIPTIFITGEEDYIWKSKNHGWKTKLQAYINPERPFILKVYKNATHGFDLKVFRKKRCRKLSDGDHCKQYDDEIYKKSIKDIEEFLMKYAK